MNSSFTYVPETSEKYLRLFPHRWDFLYAKHTKPGERPEWHTESRYELSDREILQGRKLYGVRFDSETKYLMIDIDHGSAYHPRKDRFAVGRMCDALKAIGLENFVAITSSYTGGIHLYFPFEESVMSWQLAGAAAWFLQCKGFLLEPGLLEIFPNPNNFDPQLGMFSKFNGHRLPLQIGSYMVNEWWELIHTTPEAFVKEWEFASRRNSPDYRAIEWGAAKYNQRRRKALSFKAQKFLEDLNQCIEPGWSGHGQTNFLLGRITLRAYVFGHVLNGLEKPLQGFDLITEIVKTAVSLPGYEDHCRHQTDIWRRAEEWAKCAENHSRYFPYGGKRKTVAKAEESEPSFPGWNRWQENRAREKICFAIADQLNKETWPSGTTERFNLLVTYNLSGETLYRHRDLWHPEHIGEFSTGKEALSHLPEGACPMKGAPSETAPNLLGKADVNPNSSNTFGGFWSGWDLEQGVIPLPVGDRGDRLSESPPFGGQEGLPDE